MNAVEAMAKAAYENWVFPVECAEPKWDDLEESHRHRLREAQCAALLALAKAELDDMMVDEAPGMIWGTSGDLINMATNNFRAICRALAEQP
jgi:hypothetical protein